MTLDLVEKFFYFFILATLLNMIWEFAHSPLFTTCTKLRWKKRSLRLIKFSLKDGLLITALGFICYLVMNYFGVLENNFRVVIFVFINLVVAYKIEIRALEKKRWEYSENMPTCFGISLTAFPQLAITGVITNSFVF